MELQHMLWKLWHILGLILFGQLHLKANWEILLLFYDAMNQEKNARVVFRGGKSILTEVSISNETLQSSKLGESCILNCW